MKLIVEFWANGWQAYGEAPDMGAALRLLDQLRSSEPTRLVLVIERREP